MIGAKVVGVGKAVPKKAVSNNDLSQFLETDDEWISSRTGIKNRYIATEESTTDLAIAAAKAAIAQGAIDPLAIDLIIVATITPDTVMPSTACMVQDAIGASHATAFDITAACSGFIYGSKVALDAIKVGSSQVALVIGAEVLSKTLDWEDRSTCVLFGDGAGAVIFASHHTNNILNIYSKSNGSGGTALTLGGRGTTNYFHQDEQTTPSIYMDGREVYRFATTAVPDSILTVLEGTGYTLEDIDYFVLHQANARIMDSVAKKLKVPNEKFFKNLSQYGNTSAASIPLALSELAPSLKKGDKVVLAGFGGGLTWGSMLLIWD